MFRSATGGEPKRIRAKAVVNAAGPWVGQVLNGALRMNAEAKVRLVQGSHIVVKRLYDHDRCYIFQNADGRIIFAIPYEERFYPDRHDGPRLRRRSRQASKPRPRKSSTSARPPATTSPSSRHPGRHRVGLFGCSAALRCEGHKEGQAQAATRDYVLSLDAEAGAPLLSVFGGKLTTYRRLAEHALELLAPHVPGAERNKGWTGRTSLPGGDFPDRRLRSTRLRGSSLGAFLATIPCAASRPRLRDTGEVDCGRCYRRDLLSATRSGPL